MEAVILLLLLGLLLLQIPAVQKRVVSGAMTKISEKMDGAATMSSVSFLPFNTLIIKDALITDNNPLQTSFFEPVDTLFYAERIAVRFSLAGMFSREGTSFRKVSVSNALLCLVVEGESQMNNLKRITHGGDPKPLSEDMRLLSIRKIDFRNFRFRMLNTKGKETEFGEHGINWSDLDLTADAKISDFNIGHGRASGSVDSFSFTEKGGYSAKGSGECLYRNGDVMVSDFRMDDTRSLVNLTGFRMKYRNYLDFRAFTDSVKMEITLGRTSLDFRSLGYFAGALCGKPLCLDILSAEAEGTVNKLNVKELTAREKDKGGELKFNGRIEDVEHFPDCSMDAYLHKFSFTTEQVQHIIDALAPEQAPDIGRYAPGDRFTLKGSAHGKLRNMKINAELSSKATGGLLTADAHLRGLGTDGILNGEASVKTDNLDMGNILGIDAVHQCTMRSSLRAEKNGKNTTIQLDTLSVSRLNILGYDYRRIVANGVLEGSDFDGRVVCADPNLSFLFQGKCNLSHKERDAIYRFYMNVGYADFQAMNLDRRGVSKGSMAMNADFVRNADSDISGTVNIRNLILENCEGRHNLGDVTIMASTFMGEHRLNLESSFASALYSGSKPLRSIAATLSSQTLRRELPAIFPEKEEKAESGRINIGVRFHEPSGLMSFIKPGLYVAHGTMLDVLMTEDGAFNGKLASQRIALGGNFIKDVLIGMDNSAGKLGLTLSSSEIQASGIKLLSNRIEMNAEKDGFRTEMSFDNRPSSESSGRIRLLGALSRDDDGLTIGASTEVGEIMARGTLWQLSPSDITWDGKTVSVSSFSVSSGDQSFGIDGGYSKTKDDTLGIYLDRIDLGRISDVFSFKTKLEGSLSGKGSICSGASDGKGIYASVTVDSTYICGYQGGTVKVGSSWNSEYGRADFYAYNRIAGKETISIKGAYSPSSGEINGKARLDSIEVGYLSALFDGLFSRMEGTVSGDVSLAGPLHNPSVYSRNARIDNALLRLDFTNVEYTADGPFHVNDNGLFFDGIDVRDSASGRGTVSGGMLFDHLKNPRMDTHIRLDNIQAFNVEEDLSEGRPFWGQLNARGNIDVRGPLDDILLTLKLRTAGSGDFHIPLSEGTTSGKELLTFTAKTDSVWVDPYELMLKSSETRKKGNTLSVKLDMSITPEVECFLKMDRSAGIEIKGHGLGNFKVDYSTLEKNDFTINGDYTLNDGNFHFAALGLVSKDFTIRNGSSVKFMGALMDSELDINASYLTKASIATLVADSTATGRHPVECGIAVRDKLRNPSLDFSVNVPDLEPSMKSMVQSALNTEDKIQKQFLSLLITNNFIPDEQSGIVNNSDLLYSNVTEIMAAQLNKILQKLEIPLDLGFKYQPNDGGTDIFDVAVSTQLFNNRVLVNGSVGNHKYAAGDVSNGVTGDLDIEMKLDKRGEVRVSLFSHSADQYTNYLDNTQRNGVGVGYQKEFSTFKGLLKDIFRSRTRKAIDSERNAMTRKETVTINIGKDDE